jgi:hypothetical protein
MKINFFLSAFINIWNCETQFFEKIAVTNFRLSIFEKFFYHNIYHLAMHNFHEYIHK